ncbi:MAG: hypothetical protein ACREXW_05395 [Gammaproteobacteria bacterium]
MEVVTNNREFMSASCAAARMRPTIAVKLGRHAEGARRGLAHGGGVLAELASETLRA